MAFEIVMMTVLMFMTHWNTAEGADVGVWKGNKGDADVGEGDVHSFGGGVELLPMETPLPVR